MTVFNPGEKLRSNSGIPIKIVRFINDGGQGEIYEVEWKGKRKALKWYYFDKIQNPRAFIKNLKHNIIDQQSPDDAFLWPEELTECTKGSFGYLMPLVPKGYYTLEKIMATTEYRCKSYRTIVDACLKIVSAFRKLHNKGYSYQDLSFGNFFLDPETGDIRIGDNDNVAPNGYHTGIMGTPRFMAPEIVKGKGKILPDINTDMFSLSVILFFMLLFAHPLEGKRWLINCLPDELAEWLYGKAPLFIFDPDDSGNAPDRELQKVVIDIWSLLPDYMKAAFTKAFSQDLLKNPGKRLLEIVWLQLLTRFRNDIAVCPCGNDIFIKDAASSEARCDECGRKIRINNALILPDYRIAALDGSVIFRCQLGTCKSDQALDQVARLVGDKAHPEMVAFQNMTSDILEATTAKGTRVRVSPKSLIPVRNGISVNICGKNIPFTGT